MKIDKNSKYMEDKGIHYVLTKFSFDGDLTLDLSKTLLVNEDLYVEGNLDVYGDLYVDSDLDVDGDLRVKGDLTVYGDLYVDDDLIVYGDLYVDGGGW